MDKIHIFDNFLDDNELFNINLLINKNYGYGHTSGNKEKFENKFFSIFNNEAFFLETLFEKIQKKINKKLKLNRHYMHIQTFGLDGSYHTDDDDPNSCTFCIYFTNIDNKKIENASGDFLIKIPNEKHIICIETINNRGVFFPGNWMHKGIGYNKNFSDLRICITWKLTYDCSFYKNII
jgi:hypothetical protein